MQSAAAATAAPGPGAEDELRYSNASALSPPDSSLDDLDEYEDLEVGEEEEAITGMDSSQAGKPHFLDYVSKPPAGLEEQVVFMGQPHRTNGTAAVAAPVAEDSVGMRDKESAISQSVVLEQDTASGGLKEVSRGTWPASATPGKYAARQNHSMYNDISEIGPKMECVYSLLSMLGSSNSLVMSAKFMELSKNRETCSALRRSGCIPLLVQIIHNDPNESARKNARQTLNNVICCHPDDKAGRREVRVLKLIEQLIDYSDLLRDYSEENAVELQEEVLDDPEKHPIQSITTLMKISFDEEHRHAMCQLGALQTISSLIQLDHAVHGVNPSTPKCVTMRRYAGMILTNLTFGDGNNKSLLCSNKGFMRALVAQIQSSSDELVQVTASVLRNLSWRADSVIKQTLSEIGTVKVLTRAAMVCTIENTLKAILSALWNLSNHCPPNRSEFCEVEGALEFLIDMLTYEAPSKTMSVIENAGGILRNISSHIALREDYRRILRRKNCLKILLEQLKSPSLTVVSNACGTLGNLSGDNYEDQKFLRENGAIPMLRSLIQSKHKMISNGSSMALKNLHKPALNAAAAVGVTSPPLALAKGSSVGVDSKELPSLNARKKKALEQDLEEKFLPKGLREEKEICTCSGSPGEEEEEDDEISQSEVHIRLVEDQLPRHQEDDGERPVNYSLKEEEVYQDYQETDIDQITDYSLRYAENQSEESEEEKGESYRRSNPVNGILMPEDSVKCYYTEGTPQIISSATSMSDLRVQMVGGAAASAVGAGPSKKEVVPKSQPIPIAGGGQGGSTVAGLIAAGVDTGCNTPDKPFNYCEEGTPDFSRDASLNVLDLTGERGHPISDKPPDVEPPDQTAPPTPGTHTKQVSFLNTADETPLMFSRTSSMGSLSSAYPICNDDKSSVVSDFSRLASGVISPSELPDSPTQSMPHSPKRTGMMAQAKSTPIKDDEPDMPPMQPKSAFEDTVSKFNVENTPAAFSCATSLSNLSLEDKEDEESKLIAMDRLKGPPVLPVPEAVASEDGESDGGDDDLLLESCISMGMNSVMATKKQTKPIPPPPPVEVDDMLQRYCTEDTPARLSKATSNCDLSVLSIDTRNGHESDESSNVSEQNDRLLEECIRSGMPEPKNHPGKTNGIPPMIVKDNPISMMRNPVHMGPLYANDEMNNFYVEDSPCAHSTVSVLSDLTVASEATNGLHYKVSSLKGKLPQAAIATANDSLSSLSIESDADDHLLDEAIAAGIGSSGPPIPLPPLPTRMTVAAADANDSLDSIDSADSNDMLLEQCIETGMRKHKELRVSSKPSTVAPPPAEDSVSDSDKDYELLMECIQTGMTKGKPTSSQPSAVGDLSRNLQRLAISGAVSATHSKHASSGSKNADTTPVVTMDAGATNVMSAGVVAAADTVAAANSSFSITTSGRPAALLQQQQPQQLVVTDIISNSTTSSITTPTTISSSNSSIINSHTIITTTTTITARNEPNQCQPQQQQPSCSLPGQQQRQQQLQQPQQPRQSPLASSITMGQSGFETLLERSNEFPAGFGSSYDQSSLAGLMRSSAGPSSEMMQMSNEFMVEQSVSAEFVPRDKHKDPDLMLKSVERLTQELVSNAEHLRTVSSSEKNNTWDEDATCANDVSFPSLSVQAPRIRHSLDDDDTATISDEVDSKALDALEEQTPMNENKPLPGFQQRSASNEDLARDELHFQLGGEVQHQMLGGHFTHGTDGLSFSTVSTLTNSTIIAMEATKVANNLQNLAIVESAEVDLSKIHPPFGSDSILISDCSDTEMTFRNDSRKFGHLPSGLVAKRALGQAFNDSLNSLNNLDSIGPPSIMDELMDSMISVASITSEVVDMDSGHAGASDQNISSGHSSLTLNSSLENLIKFSPTLNAGLGLATPGGKSTPMSPKRAERRQAMKDRYKTYTIPNAELIDLNQSAEETVAAGRESSASGETKTPTPSLPSSPSPKKSSKERRQENKSRYETQIITSTILPLAENVPNGDTLPRTPIRSSIIATPAAFSPLTLQSPAPMSLERAPNTPTPVEDEDDEPMTYTIQEGERRKSIEQNLPTVPPESRSPQSSPSKMPTPTKIVAKINPPPEPSATAVPKVVRGTKKPAYVSPYRKQVTSAPAVIGRTPVVPTSKPSVPALTTPRLKSQSSLVESKVRPQPLKARASSIGSKRNSLELNGNASSGRSSVTDVSRGRDRQSMSGAIGTSGTKAKAPESSPTLIRQGTFTKDEPTNPEVPVVTSAPSTPAKSLRKPTSMIPNSASSSRLTTIAKSRIVLHKSISMDASKTTPSTPMGGVPSGESTPLSSRYRLTSARTSLIDYKKPAGTRLSTPISSVASSEQLSNGSGTAPTSPGSLIPLRRKSGIALPKRTNLTMKSNPDVLKGKLEGVRNAFVRTAASAVKTGTR